jgi:hypothetical protein
MSSSSSFHGVWLTTYLVVVLSRVVEQVQTPLRRGLHLVYLFISTVSNVAKNYTPKRKCRQALYESLSDQLKCFIEPHK